MMERFVLGAVALFVIGFIGLFIYLVYWHFRQARERRQAMRALARELGWTYRRESGDGSEYDHFGLFNRGRHRQASNTLTGSLKVGDHTCAVKAGDFTFVEGDSDSRRVTRTSYMVVHLPFLDVPSLLIRPEGPLDKLAAAFGFPDIEFESIEFNRRVAVQSGDKRFAYDVIDAQMMAFLLEHLRDARLDLERGCLLIFDEPRLWAPEDFKSYLWLAGSFLDRWPRHLVDKLETP